jgi:hypothetical protein
MKAPEHRVGLRVAVVPPIDKRPTPQENSSLAWLSAVPLVPYFSNIYDRPERRSEGVGIEDYVANALRLELDKSGLFDSVTLYSGMVPEGAADLIVRSEMYQTYQRQIYTSFAISYYGMALWLLGVPTGRHSVSMDIGLSMVTALGEKPLLQHRGHVSTGRVRGLWWGKGAAEVQDEATGQLVAGFIAKLQPAAQSIALAMRPGAANAPLRRVVLPGIKIAMMRATPGQGVTDQEATSIADILASELGARVPDGVVARQDIENLLGYEKMKDYLGCGETSCMVELGGALGVQYLLTANIGRVGRYTMVSLSLIDVVTAAVPARVTRKVEDSDLGAVIDTIPDALDELLGLLQAAANAL